jgi:hypothetical protein
LGITTHDVELIGYVTTHKKKMSFLTPYWLVADKVVNKFWTIYTDGLGRH